MNFGTNEMYASFIECWTCFIPPRVSGDDFLLISLLYIPRGDIVYIDCSMSKSLILLVKLTGRGYMKPFEVTNISSKSTNFGTLNILPRWLNPKMFRSIEWNSFFSFLFRPRGFGEFDANVPSNLVEIWLHKLRSTSGILPLLDSLDPYHASIEKPDCLAIPSAMGQKNSELALKVA